MRDPKLAEHLDFLTTEREALAEAYLLGRVPRETVLAELRQESLEIIEYQRDVLRRDVAWATQGA
jgi:hypothetical protein